MKTIYFRLFVIFITAIFSTMSICAAQVQYVVTDLGTLGGNWSVATSINDLGQIVGITTLADGSFQGFSWSNGQMTVLGDSFYPVDINNSGLIAGNNFSFYLGYFSSFQYHALLYNGGNITDMGSLGGGYSRAYALNNLGQVVGQSTTNSEVSRAFLYDNGSMKNLGVLSPGDYSVALGINNNGAIVGYSGRSSNNACLWNNNTITAIAPVSYPRFSQANAINDSGQIVGNYSAMFTQPTGFIYNGGIISFESYYAVSNPVAINNSGQAVGSSNPEYYSPHGVVWNNTDGTATLLPLSRATDINNKGQIVGYGANTAGQTHAFLLSPVGKCQSYQVQPPVCAPVERLAKWDGTNWVSVNKGDLSSGNIHVLVHGWAPGLRTFADDGGKIWDENGPKTGDNTNKDFAEKLKNAATGIKAVAPGDLVVAFNWLDMSATETENLTTEPRKSRNNTDQAAADLVNALKSAGISAGVFDGKLQIIGVSHGARVSALATENLYKNGKSGSIVVDQLTLADSPEGITGLVGANNRLASVLNGIKIGRDASSTFVDNYYSYFGESYFADDDIVNVRLNPKPSLSIGDKHIYPINWYEGASKNTTTLGLAWSPLEGDTYKNLSSNYEQDWQNPDGSIDYSREYVLRDKDAGLTPTEKWLKLDMSTLLTQGLVTGIPGGMRLTEHSPAYWHTSFSKDANDIAIEFTYQFLDAGDGDQLTLWIDDELRFVITGDLAGADAFTTDIDISDLDAGYHILSMALNNYGDMNASVDVTDFTMVSVPEPSSLFLLVVGIIFFRKRK